jgi:hypothetical protein
MFPLGCSHGPGVVVAALKRWELRVTCCAAHDVIREILERLLRLLGSYTGR